MLVGTRLCLYSVYTSSNGARNVFGKTHVTKRSASAWITVVAVQLVYSGYHIYIFPVERATRLGKEL
jgi:hypothetical protein